jgi:hypothetical protein
MSDAPDGIQPAQRLPQGFRLTKPIGDHPISAALEVWSHRDGWELRMVIDGHGLLLSTVERSVPKVIARVEHWEAVMLRNGWRLAATRGSPGG